MLTPSPWKRLFLFLAPLAVAGLLLWIPMQDALEVGVPYANPYEVNVPEGHHWIAFSVPEDDVYPTEGTTIAVALEFETVEGTIGLDSRTLLFDLEDNESVQEVIITWPDGREQHFSNIPVNDLHELMYPKTINDTLAAQWALRGPFFRFWIWAAVAVLVILFGLRVLSWAQIQEAHA